MQDNLLQYEVPCETMYDETTFHELDLRYELQVWPLKENINLKSVSSLLNILGRRGYLDNCSDARTLLQTPRSTTVVREVIPGIYHHFGLKNGILQFLEDNYFFVSSETHIDIVFLLMDCLFQNLQVVNFGLLLGQLWVIKKFS